MKRWLILFVASIAALVATAPARAQTSLSNGYCEVGASKALLSGLPSTNFQMGVIPFCTITVFLHGTTTPATIYADQSNTPLTNPFTATNLGYWQFWASNGATYDVIGSGGNAPNTYPAPTLIPGGGGGGGGGSSAPQFSVQFALNASGQFGSDPNITINPTDHSLSVAGAGTGSIELVDSVSVNGVTQTVQPGTTDYTYSWPQTLPAVSGCSTATSTGLGSFQGCITGFTPPSIASAITAATNTGPVIIPGNYTGSDRFSSNQFGVKLEDERPLCLTVAGGNCTATNPNAPVRVVSAADYGAVCKGVGSGIVDTAALQAALDTQYTYNQPTASNVPTVVRLPMGACVISYPLEVGLYGAIQGQGVNSYLVCNYQIWVGSDYNCLEMTYNGPMPGGASQAARKFSDFSIIGIGSVPQKPSSTAISIIDTSGQYDPTSWAFPNMDFDNIFISDFDTAFYAEDMVNTSMNFLNIIGVRRGIVFNGQVVNVMMGHINLETGSLANTSTSGVTTGMMLLANSKYIGGTCGTDGYYCGTQGIILHDSSIDAFGTGVEIGACVQCDLHDNLIDQNGAGNLGNTGIQIDQFGVSGYGTFITKNVIGLLQTSGAFGIYSRATNGAGNEALYITDNQFFIDAGLPPTGEGDFGIVMAGTGGSGLFQTHIDRNNFSGLTEGIVLESNLQWSSINDNIGYGQTTYLINLAGIGGTPAQTNLQLDGNQEADDVPVINFGASTGYRVGWNISNVQWIGTQQATVSGCTISSGAIGNTCNNTITFPTALHNTNYLPQCQAVGGSGLWTVGQVNTLTDTTFIVPSVAMTTSATGGGSISCSVSSLQ